MQLFQAWFYQAKKQMVFTIQQVIYGFQIVKANFTRQNNNGIGPL